jgi:hypothetical protein
MKKITIVLIIILITVVVSKYYFFPSEKNNDDTKVYKFEKWRYQIENGAVTLTQYAGKETKILIPDVIDNKPVKKLGDQLFMNHVKLIEVIIPDSVISIGSSIFKGCSSLKRVHLPKGILKIPAEAFFYCTSLEEIVIPEPVQEIGSFAFQNCEKLRSIKIPDSVTNIGQKAFANNSELIDISISKNVKMVGASAFRGTPWLDEQKDEFVIIGDHILLKYNGNQEIVQVPVPISSIVDAFEGNVQIKKVLLPATLRIIGDHAFASCINLQEITIPSNVVFIQNSSFSGCVNLSSVTFSEKLVSIGSYAFQRCLSLNAIEIPQNVKKIDEGAFSECAALQTVMIPSGVEEITSNVFDKSPNIKLNVSYGSPAEAFAKKNNIPFVYLREIYDDYSFQRSEKGVEIFRYVGNMFDVRIPDKIDGFPVWKIGAGAFQNNSSVRSIVFPVSIKEIGDFAFSSMPNLESVIIFENLEKIGKEAFSNNPKLLEITISSLRTDIAKDAFKNCPKLKINAPAGSTAEKAINNLRITEKIFSEEPPKNPIYIGNLSSESPTADFQQITPKIPYIEKLPTADETQLPLEAKSSETALINIGKSTETLFESTERSFYTPTPDNTLTMQNHLESVIEISDTPELTQFETAQPEPIANQTRIIDNKFRIGIIQDQLIITEYIGTENEIVLPDLFEGKKISIIGESVFSAKAIYQITIPDGYIRIADFAFSDMPEKVVITIPSSVTDIAINAFRGSQVIIRGFVGSTAEKFARDQKIQFRVIKYE